MRQSQCLCMEGALRARLPAEMRVRLLRVSAQFATLASGGTPNETAILRS